MGILRMYKREYEEESDRCCHVGVMKKKIKELQNTNRTTGY